MVVVSRTSKSAKNRYLYHSGKLNRLPSSALGLFSAMLRLPLIRSIIPGVLCEPFVKRSDAAPESVDAFLRRRFGAPLAENLASAMMHGIYAGDSRTLCASSVLKSLVLLEKTHGSVLRGMLLRRLNPRYIPPCETGPTLHEKQAEVEERMDPVVLDCIKHASIYSFPNGLGEIVRVLEDRLTVMPNVEIWRNAPCQQITMQDGRFALQIPYMKNPLLANRLLSAIPSYNLAPLLPNLPHLDHNPPAKMAVVDVVLAPPNPTDKLEYKLPIDGFGFLVPRNATNNQDEVLGVVLDSDAVPNQDQGKRRFIKLTVMLGGPYWSKKSSDALPSEEDVEQRALRALNTQLGIPSQILASHVRLVNARVLCDTIPQYLVGHYTRMQALHDAMVNDPALANKLTLLGYSYAGVGINDCITNALDACDAIIAHATSDTQPDASASQTTGLAALIG
ncbi:hypothetical protein MVES1_001296 [Malassezia vespertilionis]|uniref:Protoporphyrinogen oxidase n=1 Tax=Malassezia vespertilionis TaxID=2020962 RepID=A0A2N1JF25_9BASI|nr:uncharacterized protein MVES1_001296 [Malassezia vespertilionis]PKI85152.1 Hem14p [Malassezia vespertilionis]WFD05958.1 hypothetical protein MVES1_001296 [Malassezia vespertilionis]